MCLIGFGLGSGIPKFCPICLLKSDCVENFNNLFWDGWPITKRILDWTSIRFAQDVRWNNFATARSISDINFPGFGCTTPQPKVAQHWPGRSGTTIPPSSSYCGMRRGFALAQEVRWYNFAPARSFSGENSPGFAGAFVARGDLVTPWELGAIQSLKEKKASKLRTSWSPPTRALIIPRSDGVRG